MLMFQRHLVRSLKQVRAFTSSKNLSSKEDKTTKNNEDKNENEQNKKERKLSKEEANSKLNDLLKMMAQREQEPTREVKVPRAVKHEREKPVKEKPLGEKLADAAKDVATTLGGDVQQTQSELLNILLKRSEPNTQVKDVLSGMKVDKSPAEKESRAQQVRASLADKSRDPSFASRLLMEKYGTKRRDPVKKAGPQVDILGAQPSSYFASLKPASASVSLSTWDACVERDLRLAATHPPANIYEQMIQWTNRGMLWRFPIDNEQGLEEEKQVPFEEHIFLETHLEGWCPERGPVRHFMELVCVGLSKNHWLTVEEKKNHIYWFRDYFADKKELLKELGAGTIAIEENQEQKEISQ